MVGKSIAHYEITSKLGQGGMGEVFLARDTKLNREVALKFLPLPLQQDENARLRFLREAKAVAALDHPYICSIHEVGQTEDGHDFIAMEYVAGQTLQERLAGGPIPLSKALPILIEAAEAIEKAHAAGFIHRDLKPANLMLTPEGHVKVMDFGLAKRIHSQRATEQEVTAGLTREGTTLGTLSYMSPEQIRGEELDARSDIFSFGVVLYETLTGEHPFRRKQPMETASAIMNEAAPPLGRYIGEVPYGLELAVKKLLSKDPERRYQLIHDVKTDLEDVKRELDTGSSYSLIGVSTAEAQPTTLNRFLPWVGTFLFALMSLLLLWSPWEGPLVPETRLPRRLDVKLSPGIKLVVDAGTGPAAVLSPDETVLAFVGESEEGGERLLYIRRLDGLEAQPLPGTESVRHPIFSPDGQWILFRADRQLKKISLNGGVPVILCNTRLTRGAEWTENGWIYFVNRSSEGISRIPENGGPVELAIAPTGGESRLFWPQMLPDGETLLFTESDGNLEGARIVAQRSGDGEKKVIWRGGHFGRYLSSGHLVYLYRGTLFAAAFDRSTLELRGQPVPILENVLSHHPNTQGEFFVSQKGTLVYSSGASSTFKIELVDREDNRTPLLAKPTRFEHFKISPDGHRLAVEISDGRQNDIWIYEWARDTMTRLTFDEADDTYPLWSPDGGTIIFKSERESVGNIYWKRADGTGQAHRLTDSSNAQNPYSWHPSGRYVAVAEITGSNQRDIRILTLEGSDQQGWASGTMTTLLGESFGEFQPVFSPDGNWLAYTSAESGRGEIYVRPFPGAGPRQQVSNNGGWASAWARDGATLYYERLGQLFSVPYQVNGKELIIGRSEQWSQPFNIQAGFFIRPEVHPDGRVAIRLPFDEESEPNRDGVIFIENFFDYLKEKVPVDQ